MTGDQAAIIRTNLAYERTLMAWTRTATSLISFGFTIYKFFQYMLDGRATAPPERWLDPRGIAIVMLGLGVTSLTLATLQHRHSIRILSDQYAPYGKLPPSLAVTVAGIMAGLGLVGLVLIFFRQ